MTQDLWLFQHLENEHGNYVREKINKEIESVEKGIQVISRNIHILTQNIIEATDPLQKEQFIENLQKYYMLEDDFKKKRRNLIVDKYNIYICCSPHVRNFLVRMGSKLKDAMPTIDISDIYIALILVAYSMLGEQYYDMIRIRNISEDTKTIFFGITAGDIMYHNENLSSEIRRFFIQNESKSQDIHTKVLDSYMKIPVPDTTIDMSSDSSNYGTPPEYEYETPPNKIKTPISPSPNPIKRKNRSSPQQTHKKRRIHSGGKKKKMRRQTKRRTK